MAHTTQTLVDICSNPGTAARLLRETFRARRYASLFAANPVPNAAPAAPGPPANPLRNFFEANRSGPGIWKWTHYFDAYVRHLSRFVGQDVHVLEIGVYSGGSLRMWRDFFGDRCQVYGVDIEPACRQYENTHTRVFIGDQADRAFWHQLRRDVPRLDIVIDDGGHRAEQQVVTLEETLPYLSPGGVYLCEDVHGATNAFHSYVYGLVTELSHYAGRERRGGGLASDANAWQSEIASIHQYPYLTVIERHLHSVAELVAPKHGTEWQPFL